MILIDFWWKTSENICFPLIFDEKHKKTYDFQLLFYQKSMKNIWFSLIFDEKPQKTYDFHWLLMKNIRKHMIFIDFCWKWVERGRRIQLSEPSCSRGVVRIDDEHQVIREGSHRSSSRAKFFERGSQNRAFDESCSRGVIRIDDVSEVIREGRQNLEHPKLASRSRGSAFWRKNTPLAREGVHFGNKIAVLLETSKNTEKCSLARDISQKNASKYDFDREVMHFGSNIAVLLETSIKKYGKVLSRSRHIAKNAPKCNFAWEGVHFGSKIAVLLETSIKKYGKVLSRSRHFADCLL